LLLLIAAAWPAAADSPLRLQPSSRTTEWTIYHGAQKVLVYSFDPVKFKPYVKELYTTKGYNILRDSPFDHLHHHALMYGIKVNGINFWEEVPGSGVEKPVESPEPQLSAEGQPQARITQVIHWVAPQDAFLPDTAPVVLLVERRQLRLTVSPARREVALEWKSHFEVGNKTNTVTLSGSTYFGLGMRFRQDLDTLAQHRLAGTPEAPAGPVLDLSKNRQDLSPAPWAAVSFDLPDHPATIALAGHPSNARGDAVFFSMLHAFPYLSATQGLNQEPLVYHQGDTFDLNYLVLVYPESKPSETLARRVEAWRQTKP
jgi:hypothetical protein